MSANPIPDRLRTCTFRNAQPTDAAKVSELVAAAYGPYVERIGMTPRPDDPRLRGGHPQL